MRSFTNNKNNIGNVGAPIICLSLFLVTMFINPDPYLGIADHYIFLFAYIACYILCKKKIGANRDTKIALFIMGWLTLSCLVGVFSGGISRGYVLSYFIYAVVLLLANGTKYSKKEIDFLINCYLISSLIICLFIIVFRYDYYGSGGERFTIQVMGNPAIDPNYLAAYLVVPFIISYSRLIKTINIKNAFTVIIIGLGMLSTASRGALLSAVLGSFVATYLYFKGNKKIRKILLIIVAVIIVGVVLINVVPSNSLIRLFEFSTYNDGSNSKRLSNWLVGFEAFAEKSLLGYGPQGEMSIIQKVTGRGQIAHNTYIALLLQFGGIGTFLLGAYTVYLLHKNKKNYAIIGGLVGTLAVIVFISGQVAVFFWIPLILASVMDKCVEEEIISEL